MDVSEYKSPTEKEQRLLDDEVKGLEQAGQLNNPDVRIVLSSLDNQSLLSKYAESIKGLTTGDGERLIKRFWEFNRMLSGWKHFGSTTNEHILYGGRENLFFWCKGKGPMQTLPGARTFARAAWGKTGVSVCQMGRLPVPLYTGEPYDNNVAVIVPREKATLPALWAFCSSPQFHEAVRKLDQSIKPTNSVFDKVPFDLEHWRKVAEEKYPDGLCHVNVALGQASC